MTDNDAAEADRGPTYRLLLIATLIATIVSLIIDRLIYLFTLIIFGRQYDGAFLWINNINLSAIPFAILFSVGMGLYVLMLLWIVQRIIHKITGQTYRYLDLAFNWCVAFFFAAALTLIIAALIQSVIFLTTGNQIIIAMFLASPIWTWTLEGPSVKDLLSRAVNNSSND